MTEDDRSREQSVAQPIDQRGRLEEEIFAYRTTKDGRVLLTWEGRLVKTLAGAEAKKFLARIINLEGKEAQLVMAKVTGNFKHGNERRTR